MKHWILGTALASLTIAGNAFAQQGMSKEEWIKHEAEKEFKDSTMTRLKALEAKFQDSKTGKDKAAPWTDFIRFYGDFRLRHETIDTQTSKVRHRSRIRARLNMDAMVNDEVDFGFRVATGESSDPVSTNQTLTGGFAKKSIFIDKAMVNYHPDKNMVFWGGKMDNPFYQPGKSDLVWDHDLTPEGVAAKFKMPMEGGELFFNGGGFWVNEKSGAQDDTALFAGQVGAKMDLGGDMKMTIGGSYYAYPNSKGDPTFFSTSSGFGNQTAGAAPSLTYAKEFNELELFLEIATKLGEMPFSLYGSRVKNVGTNDQDDAWLAGISLGKLSKPGDWAILYYYKILERNSVIGAFTDSDAGGGGVNYKGHKISLETQIAKKWAGAVTYHRNETGIHANSDLDYHRLQFDLMFKF